MGYQMHVSLGIFLEVIHFLSVFMNVLTLCVKLPVEVLFF